MPATGIRCTFIMQLEVDSITETHIYTRSNQIADALNPALALFKYRMQLNGPGVTAFGLRMSAEGVFRDTQAVDQSLINAIPPGPSSYGTATPATPQPGDPDQPKSCVMVQLESGTLHRRKLYMAGIPDALVGENPVGPRVANLALWKQNFDIWAQKIVDLGFGFVVKPATPGEGLQRVNVVAVSFNAITGQVGIDVAAGGPAYAMGDMIQLRSFLRSNVAYPSLNGTWQVAALVVNGAPTNTTTYYLRNSSNVPISQITRLGTVEKADHTTVAYQRAVLQNQTTRKRGRSVLGQPGKRRTRKPLPV